MDLPFPLRIHLQPLCMALIFPQEDILSMEITLLEGNIHLRYIEVATLPTVPGLQVMEGLDLQQLIVTAMGQGKGMVRYLLSLPLDQLEGFSMEV